METCRVIDKDYPSQTDNGVIAHFNAWANGKMKGIVSKY